MNSQKTSQEPLELLQANERALLVMLVQEMEKIRRLALETDYSLSISEKRSGAWGAEYSGEIHRGIKEEDCFIATAAYGSASAQEVIILRRFRDVWLKKSRLGCWLIRMYELWSPLFANIIAQHSVLRAWARRGIVAPMVWFAHFWISRETSNE